MTSTRSAPSPTPAPVEHDGDDVTSLLIRDRPILPELAASSPLGSASAVAPAIDLYAACFGVFALYRARAHLPLGRQRAVIELGRYLVTHAGRMVPRDVLLDLLWPEAEPARVVHRLHVAVSSLRGIVDVLDSGYSHIHLEDECYSIGRDEVVTDSGVLENYYKHGVSCLHLGNDTAAADAFGSVIELYSGEYLADNLYAEWTHLPRAHFRERHLVALTFMCEYALYQGKVLAVAEYAERILEIDDLRERAHRHLMRAHYLLGERARALRQYDTCAAILEHELGVLPSLPTQSLYQAIANDTPLPSETPLHF